MKTIEAPPTINDPVIAEVRKHKQEIAGKFGFDVIALARSLQQRQLSDHRVIAPAERGISAGNRCSAGI